MYEIKRYKIEHKKIAIFLLWLALMDLCDEADTTNDGKISVEEYLLITRNYGIKVNITRPFIKLTWWTMSQLSNEDIRLVEHLANANRELSKNDFIFHIKAKSLNYVNF